MIETEDVALSEYGASPKALLAFSPGPWDSFQSLTHADLETYNFLGLPDANAFYAEHAAMMGAIARYGGKILELAEYAEGTVFEAEATDNPNLLFTRDSSVTAPFLGSLVVKAQMGLGSRFSEPTVVSDALASAGYDTHTLLLGEQDTLEGGDVIPVSFDGKSTLLVGVGERTTLGAAQALLFELPIDQVIAIKHPHEVLHLDTGLSLYPGVAVVAEGMFEGAQLMQKGKTPQDIDMKGFLAKQGYSLIEVPQQAAVDEEVCNVLPLGPNADGQLQYVGFEEMGADLIAKIQDKSDVAIHTTPGGELALATGGVHCSTRPLYSEDLAA